MSETHAWFFVLQGERHGPISVTELRQMIASRQLLPTDLVWREGFTHWLPLQSVANLQQTPGGGPPPLPVQPMSYYTPQALQPGNADDLGQNAGIRMLIPVGRSPWAIAAGYLGLLSLIPIVGVIAVIIGIIAILDMRRNPEKHGMGRAITGLALGGLGTLVWVFVIGKEVLHM